MNNRLYNLYKRITSLYENASSCMKYCLECQILLKIKNQFLSIQFHVVKFDLLFSEWSCISREQFKHSWLSFPVCKINQSYYDNIILKIF